MKSKAKNSIPFTSAKSDDQPATRKMLKLARTELKSDIRSLERRMDSRFNAIDARFDSMDSRLARMELSFEEQNANNRIVLEGLQMLWQKTNDLGARSS